VCLVVVLETDKLLLDFYIIQERKLLFTNRNPLTNARIFVKRIVITEIILINDLVYQFTSFAAKNLLFRTNFVIQTVFTTMVTLDFLIGDGWHSALK
jgi:hypothetical protein